MLAGLQRHAAHAGTNIAPASIGSSSQQFDRNLFCSEQLRDAELSGEEWKGGWGPCLPFNANLERRAGHSGKNIERSDRQKTVQGVEAQGGVALYRDWEAADHENGQRLWFFGDGFSRWDDSLAL